MLMACIHTHTDPNNNLAVKKVGSPQSATRSITVTSLGVGTLDQCLETNTTDPPFMGRAIAGTNQARTIPYRRSEVLDRHSMSGRL